MAKRKKMSASTSPSMSRASSRDPEKVSRYYHEAMRDAIEIVKEAEAQRRSKQQSQ